MSISRRFIGRRTIAAVAAFSMISTGTFAVTPTALAQPSAGTTTENPNKQAGGQGEFTIEASNTVDIVPGSTIKLNLKDFLDRSQFKGVGQRLVVKIDEGKTPIPEDIAGTSFDELLTRDLDNGTTQVYGIVNDLKKLPTTENNGNTEFMVRLPKNIQPGTHSITILGGSRTEPEARLSKNTEFTVAELSTETRKYPTGRLTAKRAGSDIEGVAQGTTVDLHASRLPANAEVIYAGPIGGEEKDNVLPQGEKFVTNDKGEVVIPGVKVAADAPLDSPFGIVFIHPVSGEKFSADNRRYGVTVNEQNLNADMIKVEKLVHTPSGLYQSAYSTSENKLFVTRARGTDSISELLAFNPDTLDLEAQYAPAELKDGKTDKTDEIFGIAIDEKNGNIWTSRTRGASVTVFNLKDGKVKKHFEANNHGLSHPRDIAIDPKTNKVYVGDVTSRSKDPEGKNTIKVYDAVTLEEDGTIDIPSMPTGVMELIINPETQVLYTVDFLGKTVAAVELANGNKVTNINLNNPDAPGDRGAGIALDTKRNRLWVASQSPSWVKVVDLKDNKVLTDPGLRTGASPLDALYDAKNDVIWTLNRVGASVNIVDPETFEIKATRNLDADDVDKHTAYLNQLSTDGMGNIFVTSKPSRDQGTSDILFKLSYAAETPQDNNDNKGGQDASISSKVPGSSQNKDGKDGADSSKETSSKASNSSKNNNTTTDNVSGVNDTQKDFLKKLTSSDKKKNDDSDKSNPGKIVVIIGAILALLGVVGHAVTSGMINIPGLKLPDMPAFPFPGK